MAFFKFRTARDDAKAGPRHPESIEAIRRRARQRLIGATVLVLIGVVGFPVLFDTQPRPIPVDIPIDIPDRTKAKPLAIPERPAAQAPGASGRVAGPAAAVTASAPVQAEARTPAKPPTAKADSAKAETTKAEAPTAETKAEAGKAEPPAPAKAAPAAGGKPESQAGAEASKAKDLLEGKTVAQAAADGRFVVQVGAFADPAKAREARAKVERAGLKTYTNVADTKDGKRIRVRVGPFPTRGEADKAASKIKGLDLPAAILTL